MKVATRRWNATACIQPLNSQRKRLRFIRMARRKNPYYVVPLQYEDIYDFKEVTKSTLKYSKVYSEGIKVNWMKIKWLRFSKNDAEHVLLKHKFDEDFKKMRVVEVDKKGMLTTSQRGRVVEVDKKGMLTTSLQGRVVEVDKKGMLTTNLRGRVVEVDKKGMLTTSLQGRVVEVDKKGMLTTSLRGRELQR